jgi:cell division septation protein DedD
MSIDARDARGLPEEGFHEIQLSGKQLVFLFMATTVVSVVIFLCGVLVGRGVRQQTGDGARDTVTATDTSAPDPAVAAPTAEVTPPPSVQLSPAEPAAGSEAAEQLMADQPPAENVEPRPQPAVEEPRAAPARAPASKAAQMSAPAAGSGWVVQVTALRQRQEAAAIARRLSQRGYKAFVLDPQPGSTPLYRVRVGPFTERSDAEQVVERLTREEQFNPWISR